MILFEGKLLQDDKLDEVLERLWESCLSAIINREDIAESVMYACERVATKLRNGQYDSIVQQLLSKGTITKKQFDEAVSLFDRNNLKLKYDVELERYRREVESDLCAGKTKYVKPLGILFHIAAGNAEGLPFYSVLEGLLSGNVNILKLPSMDDGLSILLLYEIIKEEPALAPYVCVLDVSSNNMEIMRKVATMADGIVVWGGDAAIQAVRTYAEPNTQIISWGHKLSFAYVTEEVLTNLQMQQELYALARHMCDTKQVLCSSCQGIYIDSNDRQVLEAVGNKYFEILKEVSMNYPKEPIGVRGKLSITLYNEELENSLGEKTILRDGGVSVIINTDSKLELAHMFRNCWVKPLLRNDIVRVLKENKGYLQTVGLICKDEDRELLVKELIKAGVVQITHGGNMSEVIPGGTHDGEYPLRRYCKIVEVE